MQQKHGVRKKLGDQMKRLSKWQNTLKDINERFKAIYMYHVNASHNQHRFLLLFIL